MNELIERRCVNIEKDVYAGVEKRLLSQEIERQTAEFLANGGKINEAEPNEYSYHPQLSSIINQQREVERADRMALLPFSLRQPKNESGCRGVTRDGMEWVAKWRQVKIGKFATIQEAIDALLAYLSFIGYKAE